MSDSDVTVRIATAMAGEGLKHDAGRPRLDLVIPDFVIGIGDILKFGAEKYADRNWEQGILFSRVYRANLGHLFDFWNGKVKDEETGRSHLLHAACCTMFLHTYEQDPTRYAQWDDRP